VEEEFSEIAFPVGRFHPGFIAACYSRIVGDLLHWCAERLSAQSNGRDGGSSGGGVSFSFSYKELIATGLAGALLAFLALALKASPILIGALSPMASTVIMAIVKAYSSGAALGGPRLPGILYILGAFWWFASRARETGVRQAILWAGLRAGLVSTVISASVVGGTAAVAHQVAHKDLP
jgi:hypothetical protein